MNEVIKAEHLIKKYGDNVAINDVSILVEKGKILGLLGANGAGKTTTIECILGTKVPENGKISILGMNPIKDRKKLFEKVGVQFQESSYQDKITVDELCEVTTCLYKNSDNYTELLKKLGLEGKGKRLVSELSGGQKQRLFIVLALIPKPEVIFLDELTTGLDTRARREVWKSLLELKEKGLTVLLTSHFMDEVEALCDNICILKKGKIVFYGTVEEAKKSKGFEKFEDAYLYFTDEEEENNENICYNA